MQRPPRLETAPLQLAANETRVLALDGDFFDVVEATGAIEVAIDGVYVARLEKGLGWEAPLGQQGFTRLHVRDLTGAPNTVRIAYGVGAFHDRRTNISGSVSLSGALPAGTNSIGRLNSPASVDDAADVALNNGAETSLGAAPANTKYRVIVADPANTVDIRIGKTGQVGAARGALLQPGATLTIEGTATPYAYAGAAGQKVSQLFVVY